MFAQLTEADTGRKVFLKAALVRRVMEGKQRTKVLFDDGFWRSGEIDVNESVEEVVARVSSAASGAAG